MIVKLFGGKTMNKEFDMISIYKSVLNGHLKRFPPETWNPFKSGYDHAHRSFRYLILELLKWEREDFCRNINMKTIQKYRLNGAFSGLYERNIYPFVTASFPEWEIKPWELEKSRVPKNYWNEETAREAVRWLIEEKLNWNKGQVERNLSASIFEKYNLGGLLQLMFQRSPYLAVSNAYPDQDWSMKKELRGYRLTNEETEKIREMHDSGEYSQRYIAKEFGLSPANVCLIVNNKSRKTEE